MVTRTHASAAVRTRADMWVPELRMALTTPTAASGSCGVAD